MGPIDQQGHSPDTVTLFLAGDVMTGRGIDQVLPFPADPQIHETFVKSASDYVKLAERANGPIQRPVAFDYIWGDALTELERRRPDARIINLETALTQSTAAGTKGHQLQDEPGQPRRHHCGRHRLLRPREQPRSRLGVLGLLETLCALEQAKVHYAGAGRDSVVCCRTCHPGSRTQRSACLCLPSLRPSAGVPRRWARHTRHARHQYCHRACRAKLPS